jgi:hypothetical protein
MSVVGLLPVGVGSPDQSGEIWSLWFLLSLLELLWPELETVKRATTPSNKADGVAFLQVWISSISSSPLAGHGGGGWWSCAAGSALVWLMERRCLLWSAMVARRGGGAALGAL